MSILEVVILGLVQGIAEFLPISSSGHLVIMEALMGHHSENLELNVALHFGTLLSILVVYRKDLLPALTNPKLVLAVILATLPVVFSGLVFKDFFEAASQNALYAGFGLLYTSALLFLTPRIDNGERPLEAIRFKDALVIGLFQAIAPFPGISRSGSTIVCALLMGMRRDGAANFSFYIAVPALLGATVLTLKDIADVGTSGGTSLVAIGFGTLVSFVVGVAALQSLLRVVAARKLGWFAWYVLAVGIITIIGSYQGWI